MSEIPLMKYGEKPRTGEVQSSEKALILSTGTENLMAGLCSTPMREGVLTMSMGSCGGMAGHWRS